MPPKTTDTPQSEGESGSVASAVLATLTGAGAGSTPDTGAAQAEPVSGTSAQTLEAKPSGATFLAPAEETGSSAAAASAVSSEPVIITFTPAFDALPEATKNALRAIVAHTRSAFGLLARSPSATAFSAEIAGAGLVRITARKDGFRRCGRTWSDKGELVEADDFTPDQMVLLENEPNLIVEVF